MDIAALSTAVSQANLAQAVSLQVMSLAKTQAVQQSTDMIRMMEMSIRPNLGANLDIRV
ncbi:YjfB family protein [Gorillibacterium sp. sgz5001074]|uniref:YjfB family protein n=1 Tax=Gorillibacterium sp. sgz5001074 TaxID=3446695 RepID=UPI003F67E43F